MKRLLLFSAVCALAYIPTGCEETKPKHEVDVLDMITDPVFLAYCQNAMNNEQELFFESDGYWTHPVWDTDGNGKLSPEEAAAVSGIDLHGYYVNSNGSNSAKEDKDKATSFAGIEYFTGLIMFNCSHNLLTELDISSCTGLLGLYCSNNRLSSLDLSGNAALIRLTCHDNQLISLDVSNCVKLTELGCASNLLSSLDVSKCALLTRLTCGRNPGDTMSKFPVTAWFDNNSIPDYFEILFSSWNLDDKTISIDFQKVN